MNNLAYQSSQKYEKSWRYFPGKCAKAYLFFTAISYFFSPFKSSVDDGTVVFIYSLAAWSFFVVGEWQAEYRVKSNSAPLSIKNPSALIGFIAIYTSTIIYLTLSANGWLSSFDDILSLMLSPGESYFKKFEIGEDLSSTVSSVGQIYTLSSGLLALIIPFGVFYWKRISFTSKVCFVVAVLFRLLPGLVTGTMVDVALVFVELTVAFLFLMATGQVASATLRKMKFGIFAFGAFFVFFGSYAQIARVEYMGYTPWLNGDSVNYNADNFLSLLIGGKAAYGVHALLFYANHGYEGLAQCLELDDFRWTYGVGHSRALMEYAEQYLGWNWIWDNHLMWRNQLVTGRDPLMFWSTALPWIASDVTFFGVLPILFLFGLLFGKTWRDAIRNRDPIALALFVRLVILVLFLPANNQIFQSRAMWWSSMELMALYFFSRIYSKK